MNVDTFILNQFGIIQIVAVTLAVDTIFIALVVSSRRIIAEVETYVVYVCTHLPLLILAFVRSIYASEYPQLPEWKARINKDDGVNHSHMIAFCG